MNTALNDIRNMNIKLLKMTSGEEVLCDVRDVSETGYVIKHPQQIRPTADPAVGSYYIMVWLIGSEQEEFTIPASSVMLELDPVDEFVGAYIQVIERTLMKKALEEAGVDLDKLDDDEEDEWDDSKRGKLMNAIEEWDPDEQPEIRPEDFQIPKKTFH